MLMSFLVSSRRRHTRCSGVSWVQAEDGIRDAQESRGLGDVYKRQGSCMDVTELAESSGISPKNKRSPPWALSVISTLWPIKLLSLIHISEPTRLLSISYAVFCLKK